MPFELPRRRATLPFIVSLLHLLSIPPTSLCSSPPECPYPCFPSPPTSVANYPPPPSLPATPTMPGEGYPPPQPGEPGYGGYPPPVAPGAPGGYYMQPPPPSPYVNFPAPPPPNPILPWFPWYYNPPAGSAAAPPRDVLSGMIVCVIAAIAF